MEKENKQLKEMKKTIYVLKKLVKAQDNMILAYRVGRPKLPEWVFDSIDRAKKHFNVHNISDIR